MGRREVVSRLRLICGLFFVASIICIMLTRKSCILIAASAASCLATVAAAAASFLASAAASLASCFASFAAALASIAAWRR